MLKRTGLDDGTHAPGRSNIQALILVGAFALLVGIATGAGILTPDAKESVRENRRLQSMPPLPATYLDLRSFVHQLERYATDQVGFRERFIQSNRRLRFELFGVLNSNRCFLGKDLWLFLDRPDDSFDHKAVIAGKEGLNDFSVERWVQFLKEQAGHLEARGTRFLVVFIPNKYALYPEQLPEGLECDLNGIPYLPIAQGLKDQPNVKVVDLLQPLLAARSHSLLYSPGDSHWNGRGAYFGYREIIGALTPWFPDLVVRPHSDFELTSEIVSDYRNRRKPMGNLARSTGMPLRFPREWLGVVPKQASAIEGEMPDILWPPVNYRVAVPAAFENEQRLGPRILYIGDSFRWPLVHLLSEDVKRVLFVDARHVFFDQTMIEAEQPDLIIFCVDSYFFMNDRDPYLLTESILEAERSTLHP